MSTWRLCLSVCDPVAVVLGADSPGSDLWKFASNRGATSAPGATSSLSNGLTGRSVHRAALRIVAITSSIQSCSRSVLAEQRRTGKVGAQGAAIEIMQIMATHTIWSSPSECRRYRLADAARVICTHLASLKRRTMMPLKRR